MEEYEIGEAIQNIHLLMIEDETQPQRALHNFLVRFVDDVSGETVRIVETGRVVKFTNKELVSWIKHFAETYEETLRDNTK